MFWLLPSKSKNTKSEEAFIYSLDGTEYLVTHCVYLFTEVTPAGPMLMKESSELQSCATLGTYLLSESRLLIDKL